jgi:excisionase family DNA binding protein
MSLLLSESLSYSPFGDLPICYEDTTGRARTPPGTEQNKENIVMPSKPMIAAQPNTALIILDPEAQTRLEPLQVTIEEAARLMGYDSRTIRRLITRGEISAVGEGRMRRVPIQSLRDYIQRHIIT